MPDHLIQSDIYDNKRMAPFTIQRPPSAPLSLLPRSDIQLAADAWKFIKRQVHKLRERRYSETEAVSSCYKTESAESTISKAGTLVVGEGFTIGAMGKKSIFSRSGVSVFRLVLGFLGNKCLCARLILMKQPEKGY